MALVRNIMKEGCNNDNELLGRVRSCSKDAVWTLELVRFSGHFGVNLVSIEYISRKGSEGGGRERQDLLGFDFLGKNPAGGECVGEKRAGKGK